MAKSPFNNVEDSLYNGPLSSDLGGAEVELPEDGIDESDDFTIEEDEDGGATITFGDTDPEKMDISSLGFGDNLALVLDDSVLATVSQDLSSAIDEDDSGREEWKKTYEEGLTLLGLTYTERTEPFNGSTGVTHPLLNEAVTQFQAQSYKELLPASGPARARIVGKVTPEREQQADRVKNYMNYQITEVMEEYDPEFDQMLFYVGYGGSAFKKVYYDGDFGRAVSPYILPKDLIVPYGSRDLATAERVTHVLRVSENELRKQQVTGFYRDVDLTGPTEPDRSDIDEKIDRISGIEPAGDPKDYVLWECHCYLDIEGFEDLDDDGEPTGIKLPYIVTIDSDSGDVLAIRRNYKKDDVRKKKKQYFVHYKFLPGLGFYGFGLIHLLGNLARSGTSILRQLIDAGTLANLPAGFKARGLRIQDQESPLQPGEWRDVDAPGGDLAQNLLPLPYKEPSGTLFQLLGFVVSSAEKFLGTADLGMSDGNQELPVGTTIALLERGSRVMSAVHKRLHYAQKQELRLLAQVFAEYMPDQYPYEVEGGTPDIKRQDFDDKIDILPVSDPNIFSMTQRIALAQQQLQLAKEAPQLHNQYEAYHRMYAALDVRNIDMILPPPPKPQAQGPAIENARSMLVPNGAPALQAFPDQDHVAHIEAHMAFIKSQLIQTSPQVYGILLAHVFEHVSMAAHEMIMQQMQQLQGAPMPPPEALVKQQAQIEAQMVDKVMADLNPPKGADPLIELQAKDLEIRDRAVKQKAEEAALRIDLDERRLAAKERADEERRNSNEDISQLRANVSLARAHVAKRP